MMRNKTKKIILFLLNLLSFIWKLIPRKIRIKIIFLLTIIESRGNINNSFISLFKIEDNLESLINERALFYGDGKHPKHDLINYHDFFIQNIENGETVLDIGCGYGAVAFSIAKHFTQNKIIGLDIDTDRLNTAINKNNYTNLEFKLLDVTKSKLEFNTDVVVLSNVLEHIEHRVQFLTKIIQNTNVKKILIRIPAFERNWKIALRSKLKIKYFSDDEHFIEHKYDAIRNELQDADLNIISIKSIWGEYWIKTSVKIDQIK